MPDGHGLIEHLLSLGILGDELLVLVPVLDRLETMLSTQVLNGWPTIVKITLAMYPLGRASLYLQHWQRAHDLRLVCSVLEEALDLQPCEVGGR